MFHVEQLTTEKGNTMNQYAKLESAVEFARLEYLGAKDAESKDVGLLKASWNSAKRDLVAYCKLINARNRASK